jgi:chromosome segregation ATPase
VENQAMSGTFTSDEKELLENLKELKTMCREINSKLNAQKAKVKEKEVEIDKLNRKIRDLIAENQHQKETLQTLKTRFLSVLERL